MHTNGPLSPPVSKSTCCRKLEKEIRRDKDSSKLSFFIESNADEAAKTEDKKHWTVRLLLYSPRTMPP